MTRPQASYLDHLCRRAGIPYDPGLNVAEAHQLITTLEGGHTSAGHRIGDRPAGPGMNPPEFARHRVDNPQRSGRQPMTAPQKALLSQLCQHAGLPYDASVDSTQASKRIAALMAAPRPSASRPRRRQRPSANQPSPPSPTWMARPKKPSPPPGEGPVSAGAAC